MPDRLLPVTQSPAGGACAWWMWLAAFVIVASAGCRYGYEQVGAAPDAGVNPGDQDAGAGIDAGSPPEPVGYGRGTDGAFELTQGELQINEYAAMAGDVARASRSLTIDRPLAARAGTLVLIWQSGTTEPAESGQQANIVLDANAIGQWELVRLSVDIDSTKVELAEATRNPYAAGTTQLVTVPEYVSVIVGEGTRIVAQPWDGKVGGIVAFLVADKLDLAGAIDVTGAGYRGGVGDPVGNEDLHECAGLDELPPGGEAKGEGVALGRYGQGTTGRGNLANGGGGGSCHNGGGGGGGNQGAGGAGGIVDYEPAMQPPALGGAATVSSSFDRLSMGGGGGAGEAHHGSVSDGGPGGGVILIGARRISGGLIEANGVSAPPASNGDAGGGGGAGGAI
ncbi:MAG TPA: hypothetical protein VNM90_00695, partial [Haliangium sp.]|nr:hypothetical protein [Haliangium sp.]